MQLILASASPRRQQFLRDLGLQFEILVADIDETPLPNENPIDLVQRLAIGKAQAVAQSLPLSKESHLIIAADTVVAFGNSLLGKPVNDTDATGMLRQLRNTTHQVHSSVSILHILLGEPLDQQRTVVNTTDVLMRNYSDEELAIYVASGDPLDKAGAYAIQHPTFAPARQLNGCLSNVIGLPLADLRSLLREFGVEIGQPLSPVCEQHAGFFCCQR